MISGRRYLKLKMGMLTSTKQFNEGDLMFKYHQARFDANKNFIGVILGPTGSGKSYTALRMCEIEYERRFNKLFPPENITFSIEETIKRIHYIKENGSRGEVILADDVGAAGYGALEFQSKTSKMFSYILQSFRSLNIGLIMTLPVLTMLNKQGRQLLHYQMVTCGIDYKNKIAKLKPYFHQLNQSSGKSYWKFARVRVNGSVKVVKRVNYRIPNEKLIEVYEKKKDDFLTNLTKKNIEEINKMKGVKPIRIPKEIEVEAYRLYQCGLKHRQIAEKLGKSRVSITTYIKKVRDFMKKDKK